MCFSNDEAQELDNLLQELEQIVRHYYKENILETIAIVLLVILVSKLRIHIVITLSIFFFLYLLILRGRTGATNRQLVQRAVAIMNVCVIIAKRGTELGGVRILTYNHYGSNKKLYKEFISYFPERKSLFLWLISMKTIAKE